MRRTSRGLPMHYNKDEAIAAETGSPAEVRVRATRVDFYLTRNHARIALWMAGLLATGVPAFGQGFGPTPSLGGYGASSGFAGNSMGGSGSMVIPYGGMFEGFAPNSLPGGSSLSFRPRGSGMSMGSARTPFMLPPLSGGMSGGGMGTRPRTRGMSPFRSTRSMELGVGRPLRSMQGMPGSSIMPPSLGYPFRQPPSLIAPSTTASGMSM